MMELKQYLILVICAAMAVALVTGFTGSITKNNKMIQVICSMFLFTSILLPLLKKDVTLNFNLQGIENDATFAVEEGKMQTKDTMCELIKKNTEAYIYDKATAMGADVKVTVTVSSDDDLPLPVGVKLEGSISPYAKSKLTSIITNDLGIAEDQLIWT